MVDKQIADLSSLNGTFNKRNNQISATKTIVTQNETLDCLNCAFCQQTADQGSFDGVFQQVIKIKGAERLFLLLNG